MIQYVIAAIAGFYLFYVFLSIFLPKKICAICGAVSSVWVSLLALNALGYKTDPVIMGILMGESVTGIMYFYEKKVKESGKNKYLMLRIFIILFGTLIAYWVIKSV